MNTNLFKLAALPLLLGTLLPSYAATPPGIGEVLQQANPSVELPSKPSTLPSVQGAPAEEAPLTELPGHQAVVTVQGFQFTGNAVFSTEQLVQAVQDATGKSLTVAQLHDVATRITRLYRNAGYFVARAYVPAQEIVGGQVRIRVIEGHYGDFNLDHHGLMSQEKAQAVLDAVKDRDIVSVDTLERAMLILNDTPGVHVTKVSVSPGSKVGTSDFNVATEPTPEFAGVVALDNYGSVYTGKNRLSFVGAWNGPTRGGDRLDVFGLATEHGDLASGRLGYQRLLTPTGLRGDVAVSHTTYSLGSTYSALDAVGHANAVSAQLGYPLILTETHRLMASGGVAYTDLVDEVRSTGTRQPKSVTSAIGGLEYASISASASTQAGALLTVGKLDIRDATARAADAAGAGSDGTFSKLGLHLERRQALPQQLQLDVRLRAQTTLTGKSLDGSQKMAISGPDGVIAYAPGEFLGDSGAVARVALSRSFALSDAVRVAPSVFIDEGWARNEYAALGASRSRSMGDAGVGISATYRQATLSLQWATRTHGGDAVSEPTSKSRVLAQLSAAF